ncbi:MAG: PEP-CTERM sorting domain-containing protein [Planctomycetes bacterium]|nr:PEP-CTERM sorting domain-containing protein [Planctomycetota bacterium]
MYLLSWKHSLAIAFAAITLALAAPVATTRADLITNGDFESNGGDGQIDYNTSATGWYIDPGASSSYTFLYTSASSAMAGANGQYGSLSLWGPDNGSNNGFTGSPTGGAFIAQDSAYQNAALQQTITGLTIGAQYTVSFDWAAAQQYGFDGDNSSAWQVSLGSETYTTSSATIPSHGFSGWMHETFTYTATASTEVLSFYATGGPPVPPFALLDGVSMSANITVPEPSMMLGSLVLFSLFGSAWGYKRLKS